MHSWVCLNQSTMAETTALASLTMSCVWEHVRIPATPATSSRSATGAGRSSLPDLKTRPSGSGTFGQGPAVSTWFSTAGIYPSVKSLSPCIIWLGHLRRLKWLPIRGIEFEFPKPCFFLAISNGHWNKNWWPVFTFLVLNQTRCNSDHLTSNVVLAKVNVLVTSDVFKRGLKLLPKNKLRWKNLNWPDLQRMCSCKIFRHFKIFTTKISILQVM